MDRVARQRTVIFFCSNFPKIHDLYIVVFGLTRTFILGSKKTLTISHFHFTKIEILFAILRINLILFIAKFGMQKIYPRNLFGRDVYK